MPIIIYEGLVNFLNPMSSNDLPRPVTMNGADDGKPKSIKSFTKPSLRMHINHNRHRYSTLGTNNKRRIRIFTKASETCETDSGAPAARAYNLTASLLVNGYTYTREISKERRDRVGAQKSSGPLSGSTLRAKRYALRDFTTEYSTLYLL
jgi:hypothetical protein